MKVLSFILLLVSATSFLIYENIPLDYYTATVRNELKEIGDLHSLEDHQFPDYEYEKDTYTYSLSSIESKAVFLKPEMLSFSVSNEVINLDWKAGEGATGYISPYHSIYKASVSRDSKNSKSLKSTVYDIEFEMETSRFHFEKLWGISQDDDFYIPNGKIDNDYVSFKVKKLEDDCPFSDELLLEIINAFLSDKKGEMNDLLTNNGVNPYYLGLPMEKFSQRVYTPTSGFYGNENNIDLTLEEKPEFTLETITFKRKGKLNDLNIDGDPTLSETPNNQTFNINIKLFQNLISQNLFDIFYEQTNNPSPEYVLTVEYLKKIMECVLLNTTELKVGAEMTNVTFNDVNDLNGTMIFNVTVFEKEDFNTLLTFELKIDFKFTPILFHGGLNFLLSSKNLNVAEVNPIQVVDDLELLTEWIVNTYVAAMGRSEFNLFYYSFDLSHYFSSSTLDYQIIDNYLSIIMK